MKTTNEVSQRFHCNVCGKSWTGVQMEHCKSCHETFNNTRAGDKHSGIAYTYSTIKFISGGYGEVISGDPIPAGAVVLSEHNEQRYCLSPEEMRAKGMNQEKNGAWNMGGRAYIPKA